MFKLTLTWIFFFILRLLMFLVKGLSKVTMKFFLGFRSDFHSNFEIGLKLLNCVIAFLAPLLVIEVSMAKFDIFSSRFCRTSKGLNFGQFITLFKFLKQLNKIVQDDITRQLVEKDLLRGNTEATKENTEAAQMCRYSRVQRRKFLCFEGRL